MNYYNLQTKHLSQVEEMCKANNYFMRHNYIFDLCSFYKKTYLDEECIGTAMVEDDRLCGFVCNLPYTYKGVVYSPLTSGLIDKKFRGKGFAGQLFKSSFEYGDVVVDMSPTEQVYKMLKKKIEGIKEITDYQLWMKPGKKIESQLSIISDFLQILDEYTSEEQAIFKRCKENFVKFIKISDKKDSCVIAYYTFSRYIVKGFEIIYVSNKPFFENYFNDVFAIINKKEKVFVAFCDHLFFKNLEVKGRVSEFGTKNSVYFKRIVKLFFSKNGYIKTANRRLILVKKDIKDPLPLGYLHSEVMFYHL